MAPREEECIGQILTLPTELSSLKEPLASSTVAAECVAQQTSEEKVDFSVPDSKVEVDPEECTTSVLGSVCEVVAGLPMSQITLKVAEEGLDMAGEVLKKTGVGASALKNVQRTTRRVRRAGSKTGISNKMGQIVLQVADFVGLNFMLGFSGLKLESLEKVETIKVVSFSDASSVDGHYDLLNEEDYPEDADSEDDPEFVPGDEDYHSSSDEEVSDVDELNEDIDLSKIGEEDDSSEEVVEDSKDLHHDLLNEDYPEDCDSEDDPDFVPGDEDDRSSSDEEKGSDDEEMYEDEDYNQDRQEDLHSEERVDAIVPVVVKHEMISPEAVCTDLEKVVEEVIFEEGHCVPMVIKSEPIDEDEVQFEEGHCVPMVIKTDPVEVEGTSTNSTYQNLLDYMDNLYSVGSLDVKEAIAVADEVENSPAVVTDELGPVSARISALERVVELEKSPKISKEKIAGGSGNCSENIDTDGLCRGMASLEVQESSSTQSNEEVSESGEIDENEECDNAEGYYKLEVEKREAEDRIFLDHKDNNINCDVNDAVDVQNDVDGSEADVRDEVDEIIENIIDCATPDCKKVEHVPDTSSDSSSDSELD